MQWLLNDGWRFVKLPTGSTLQDAQSAVWTDVELPHDFLIGQENNLYETCDGWYARMLDVPEAWAGMDVLLRFDGVYMDCDVLLDGEHVCTHHYGYTAFDVNLTSRLSVGRHEILVHVRHQSPNSRWYSGAGIYRDVMLHVLPACHVALDGTYVHTTRSGDEWTLHVSTELVGEGGDAVVMHRLLDGDTVLCQHQAVVSGNHAEAAMTIHAPKLWHPDTPCCYTLETICGTQVIRENVGFREYEFTTDRGLFVNGEHVKLHGVCLHHDLGALGSAFHVKAMRRQLLAMKAMGVNSLRTSHNPPARQVMDLCDELGILVVNELLDMWHNPKTPYDYARFFDEDIHQDVASWVRRDRNHPSMLMWSIGNEIIDCHNREDGPEVTQMLHDLVRLHDPCSNARTTFGSNFMPWEGAQRCADHVEVVGYNYGEKLYEAHHQAHPDWVIYGSETASSMSSRGIYRFPVRAEILSDEDLQCSALGNSLSAWGTRDMRRCIVDDLNCEYSLGQYLWAGIDYIGEPTPYHTRSCYFGMMDTAVFPKDYWYLFKSLWTKEPMVHIGVYWDFNPGQLIDVPVMTNCASVRLFLNGTPLCRERVDASRWDKCRPIWQLGFEPGELLAIGYDEQGREVARDVRHTPGNSARIVLSAEDATLRADGRDMTFVTIAMVDENGLPVENAVDRVKVTVEGAGRLLGLDNGDSTDRDGYKTNTRRLFSGKLLAMVGALNEPGEIVITVASPGKEAAQLHLEAVAAPEAGKAVCLHPCRDDVMPDEIPVRKLTLIPLGDRNLDPDNPSVSFRLVKEPANAMPQEVSLRITNAKGIDSPCAVCSMEGDIITVTARGDADLYLRATCCNGYSHPRLISQQEISVTRMGKPDLDPYGFIAGGLYDVHEGEIGNGNEQGLTFARGEYSMAGFTRVNFGPAGSDEITLPIFALDSKPYSIGLWDGDPRDGGELICTLPYQKPSRWNVYQPETYRLPRRLTGVHTLCFTLKDKVHLKGFSFTRQSRAWLTIPATQADTIYGDSFTRAPEGVMGIGNNVSLSFDEMDFGDAKQAMLTIDGATELGENPITVVCTADDGRQVTGLARFRGAGRSQQPFEVEVLPGMCRITFMFLPGSCFDFHSFSFKPM